MVPSRVLVALAVGFLAYTGVDILIWQRIFVQHGVVSFQEQYHAGYALVLAGLILNGVILIGRRWWALWYAAAFYTLAMSGLEDALYYVLGGKPIPAALPWLDANPLIPFHPVTSATLLASVTLWLGLWLLSLVVIRAANSARLVTARDRLATTIRTVRLAGIALVLAAVVGSAWTLTRPVEVRTAAAPVAKAQTAGALTWTSVIDSRNVSQMPRECWGPDVMLNPSATGKVTIVNEPNGSVLGVLTDSSGVMRAFWIVNAGGTTGVPTTATGVVLNVTVTGADAVAVVSAPCAARGPDVDTRTK
jgi:hypothetical protein